MSNFRCALKKTRHDVWHSGGKVVLAILGVAAAVAVLAIPSWIIMALFPPNILTVPLAFGWFLACIATVVTFLVHYQDCKDGL